MFNMGPEAYIVIGIIMAILAITIKPLRKAIGLLIIILGVFLCLSVVGIIIGIPMILVGGIFLFI